MKPPTSCPSAQNEPAEILINWGWTASFVEGRADKSRLFPSKVRDSTAATDPYLRFILWDVLEMADVISAGHNLFWYNM